MVIPGPNEPTLIQLNKIAEIFVAEMIELYGGQEFHTCGHENKHPSIQSSIVRFSILQRVTKSKDLPLSRQSCSCVRNAIQFRIILWTHEVSIQQITRSMALYERCLSFSFSTIMIKRRY
ncbi:uncharacterized protein HD556DRAFT_465208 [Suillus plorans]|uniref:Uncharacterized protein n=1 Tax=Suillus plorans TaxID=116603 RepID=A0A9P7DI34_9AGAM|nr:uncharacterized protein HD556DRAFT_465208 [Suillus plorans]KAG1793607.1 hypothetical protein HD556DRAFT_465208 [Suillus plorans]